MKSNLKFTNIKNTKEKDCRDYRQLITPFLNGKLSFERNGELLSHVDTCENCYDELRTTYMVMEGLKRLESGEAFNLGDDFGKVMRDARADYENIRLARKVMSTALFSVIVFTFVILMAGLFG